MKKLYFEYYKIIKIISKTEILIDYGYVHGAEVKDKIEIIEVGPEIIYNEKSYGTYDLIKEKLEVVEVFEKFSLCKSFFTNNSPFVSNLAAIGNPFGALLSPSISEKELNVNKNEISLLKKPENQQISLGDMVQIRVEEN